MTRPPAGQGNGSLAFMWVSLLVMAVAFVMIGLQQRHPRRTPEADTRAVSSETVATPTPAPSSKPPASPPTTIRSNTVNSPAPAPPNSRPSKSPATPFSSSPSF